MAEKRIIGIDFTNTDIRMVEVVQKGKTTVLEHFAVGEIPPGVFAAGKVVEIDRLRGIIRDLMNTHRFKGKRVVIGVSGKFGVTRLISLPRMNSTQTRDAIQLQISQYVPFSPADTTYDYKVLREVKGEDQPQQEILLAATRRSTLEGLMRAVRGAKLQVAGVKITTLTSFNLFEDQYFDSDQAVAFCDVRDNVTDISFVAENLFRLSRSVEFGSSSILDAVRRKLGNSAEEALEYLHFNPVDLTEVFSRSAEEEADIGGLAGVGKGEEPRAKVVRDAVIRVLSTFVNELMRSIRYFESQQKRRARVAKVVIFGNISFLKNLEPYIAEQTGLEVLVVNEVPQLQNALAELDMRQYHERGAEGVVPGSLAYDAVTRKRIEFNLLPREALVRTKTINVLKYVLAAYILMVALAVVFYLQKVEVTNTLNDEIAKTERDLQKVDPYFQESEKLKAEINQVAPKVEGVLSVTSKMYPWTTLMEELAGLMVDEAWVEEFSIDAQEKKLDINTWSYLLKNFMRFWVSLHNSRIYTVTDEDIDIDLGDIENDETNPLGAGSGGGGGLGRSAPLPGGEGFFAPPGGVSAAPASYERMGPAQGTRALQASNEGRKPQPLYGLPQFPQGTSGIEGFWRGRQKPFVVMIEAGFTFSIRDDFITDTSNIYDGLSDLKVN